jgi:uncharacterized protein (DUF433 family)
MVTIDHSPVSSEIGVLGGTLVFRGSRVPAQTLIDYLNDGYSLGEFLDFFPSVQKEEAEAFMRLIESRQNDSNL